MSTVLLVRHGLTALTGPVLAGRTPGVHLDERGRAQADRLATRLAGLPLRRVVTSPLERCQETVAPAVAARPGMVATVDDRLVECGYGQWTGRPLRELARDPLWRVVQAQPSAVTFPGPDGEAMRDMQCRAVAAVREHDDAVRADGGDDALWLACSHGDVIKSIVADALGLHLDGFQRITVDPCSVTVIRYAPLRPFVVRVNDLGDLAALVPPAPRKRAGRARARSATASDTPVGGGAGAADV